MEHAVQVSIQLILRSLEDCPDGSIIGIYPDTLPLFKETISAALLRDNSSSYSIIPLRGSVAEILPASLVDFEYIAPIAQARPKTEISLVVGPYRDLVNIQRDLKHGVAVSPHCKALVWADDDDLHATPIQLVELAVLIESGIAPKQTCERSTIAPFSVLGNGDYVSLYNDLLVKQDVSKSNFVKSLIRRANIQAVVLLEAVEEEIVSYLQSSDSARVFRIDTESRVYSCSRTAAQKQLCEVDQSDTSSLADLLKVIGSGRRLLLSGCIDPSRFNFFQAMLRHNDVLVVDETPSTTHFPNSDPFSLFPSLDGAEGVLPKFENLEAIVGHNYFLKRYHLAVYHKVSPVQISLLLPTRGRPSNILRLYRSAMDLADDPSRIEFIVAIDDDDSSCDELITRGLPNVTFFKIPRTVLSVYWNKCYEKATGEILHHCGDDLIFKTKSWDTVVVSAFEKVPDKVLFAFGNDGHWGESFGTHGFIHRKWAETVGYFVPPYFSSDYNDTWLNDVAKELGRHQYIEIFTEHMHPTFHKAEWDDNHKERLIRHQKDNVDEMYRSKHDERVRDAEKLRRVMQ